MKRRGALTAKQLITIIILIISFSIILIFFLGLGLKSEISKESCRNSVILRGTLPFGKSTVNLNCKTEKVCVSGGGDCANFPADRIARVSEKEQLFAVITDMMYDCWWQMGEGKVDYLPEGFKGNYCAICNRVEFDDKIKTGNLKSIKLPEFYSYLRGRQAPDGSSYLFYFYGVNSVESIINSLAAERKDSVGAVTGTLDLTFPKGYVLVTSASRSGWAKWQGIIAGTVGGFMVGGVVGAVAGGIIGGVVTGENIRYHTPVFNKFNEAEIKGLDCKEYVSLP